MKKMTLFFILSAVFSASCSFGASNAVAASEMTKKQAADFLVKLMKDKVKEGAENLASHAAPEMVARYNQVTKVIETSQLAASLCADLIKLGIMNNEKQFAKEFAIRMRKYIPEEYTLSADVANPMLEWAFGAHLPTEADFTRILYELGTNTYQAITKMSATEKTKALEAGVNVINYNSCVMSIGGAPARRLRRAYADGELRSH